MLAYLAALALIGACTFAALVPRWRRSGDDDESLAARSLARAWQVATLAAPALLVAHLFRAWGQAHSFLDPDPVTWDAVRPILFSTTWGKGWMAQVATAIIAIPAAFFARRQPATGLGLLATAALAVAGTQPLTGHAVEHPWGPALGVGLHTVHLLGGGIWLGTLFSLFMAGLRAARDGDATDVAEMVSTFSPIALGGAGLAVVAGALLGLAYVGNLTNLVQSQYGKALVIKIVLLAITMGLGAWNWTNVKPRLGEPAVTRELRRSAGFELLIGLALIAVTAVLVALPAPKL